MVERVTPPALAPKAGYPAIGCITIPLWVILAVVFSCAWIGGLPMILQLPGLLRSESATAVRGTVCGQWETKAGPGIGFFREFGRAYGMAARGDGDVWLVGHAHDGPDNTTPALLTLHISGPFSRVALAPDPPDYHFSYIGDLDFYDVAMVSGDDAWAVGSAFDDGRVLIEHWGRLGWKYVAAPSTNTDYALLRSVATVGKDDVWAVGQAGNDLLTMHWDGSDWRIVPTPPSRDPWAELTAVAAIAHDDVWAVGRRSSHGADYHTVALHFDGQGWRETPSLTGALDDVAVSPDGTVWAVGAAGGQTLALRWAGEQWQQVASPNPAPATQYSDGKYSSGLTALAVIGADDIWAVGAQSGSVPDQRYVVPAGAALIEHWDGAQWSIVAAPPTSDRDATLYDVVRLSGDELLVSGTRSTQDVWLNYFHRWACP